MFTAVTSLRVRLERYIIRSENPDDCWSWSGGTDRHGCPRIYAGYANNKGSNIMLQASRVSYETYVEAIPIGLSVLHTCDNPLCINPRHLYLGTQAENMDDMVRRGRSAKHERHSQAKITMAIAIAIRELYANGQGSQQGLANRFGLARGTVQAILANKTWVE